MKEDFAIYFAYLDRWYLVAASIAIIGLMIRSSIFRRKAWKMMGLTADATAFVKPVNRPFKNVLFVLGCLFCSIAALGPQWGQKENRIKAQGLDICFALDLSRSMLTEDVAPNRLSLAKNQLSIFLPNLGGDRTALVGFGGGAFIASPLTVDHTAVVDLLSPMDPSFVSDQSTALGSGVDACLEALGLRDINDREQITENQAKLIVLVSDGEENATDYNEAFVRAEKLGVPIYAMAVGTEKGGPIALRDASGKVTEYLKDSSGQTVISKLEDRGLKEIARKNGGKVFYASVGLEAWKSFEEAIANYKRESRDAGTKLSREDRFQWPLLIGVLLLMLDFFLTETALSWSSLRAIFRFPKNPVWILCLLSLAAKVYAYTPRKDDPSTVLYNNQGRALNEKGKAKEAQENFQKALEQNADDPDLRFNWATNRMNAALTPAKPSDPPNTPPQIAKGEVEAALKEFQDLLAKSVVPESAPPAQQELNRLYRKSLTHQIAQADELLGKKSEALAQYYQSLSEKNDFPKWNKEATAIDQKSKVNIQRLITEIAQGGGGGGGGGQGDDKKEDKDGKDGKKDHPKDGEDHQDQKQKAKFDSKEVSKDEARQILESVKNEANAVSKRKSQNESRQKTKEMGKEKGSRNRGNQW